MKADFEYRGYVFSKFGNEFVARPVDQDEAAPEIVASTLGSLVNRVDELWASTGAGKAPGWVRYWLKHPTTTVLFPDVILSNQKRRVARIKMAIATLLLGGMVATGASADALDIDKDGRVSWIDAHAFLNFVLTGSSRKEVRIKIGDKLYDTTIEYTPDSNSDVEIVHMQLIENHAS